MPIRFIVVAAAVALAAGCSQAPAAPPAAASYDVKTGKLATLSLDANRNGAIDAVSYMEGTRVLRVEVDEDENGKVDRWDFYGADRRLEKVGFSRQNDGVMDAVAYYDAGDVLSRMEISTQRDGRFDRIERYSNGRLTMSADDTNGDGRPDKWDEYEPTSASSRQQAEYSIVSTSFDDTGRGRPDRRFVYGPNGTIARVELDADGDGVFVPSPGDRKQ